MQNSEWRKKKRIGNMLLTIIVLIILYLPIFSAIWGSLTPSSKIGDLSVLPKYFEYENYIEVWQKTQLGLYMKNSIIYSTIGAVFATILSILGGYAISRFRFWGKSLYMFLILTTQMIAVTTIAVPLFLYVQRLGLFDSSITVITISAIVTMPLLVWLLKNTFDAFPVELEEAAVIDGCTQRQIFQYVVLPVTTPGIVTALSISFITVYNQFFIPLLLLSTSEKYPVLVAVYTLLNERLVPWHLVMAAALIGLFPTLIVFMFTQKYVKEGLSTGAIK